MKILTLFKVLIVGYIDLLYSDACLYPKAFGLEKKKLCTLRGPAIFYPFFFIQWVIVMSYIPDIRDTLRIRLSPPKKTIYHLSIFYQ